MEKLTIVVTSEKGNLETNIQFGGFSNIEVLGILATISRNIMNSADDIYKKNQQKPVVN